MYAPLRLSSPTRYLGLPGFSLPRQRRYLSAGEYSSYLAAYARHWRLVIEPRRVTLVERDGADYLVTLEGEPRPRRYRFVVVATGMSESPVIPDEVDITEPRSAARPTVLHAREWRGIREHDVGRVLIVGCGMRAVELAEECAGVGVQVVMSTRQARVRVFRRGVLGIDWRHVTFPLLRRIPRFLAGRRCVTDWRFAGIDEGFRSLLAEGKIALRGPLLDLCDGSATFKDGSEPWPADLVVLATGYRFETPFLPHDIPRATQGYPLVERGESRALPNLFFLRIPCAFGADSHFVHGMARDAQAVAATIAKRLGTSSSKRAGQAA
jgi:cation diffusion facilitator CzcD-associated flavoprotein CzcO